jgi:hypothetical protein
MERIGQIAACAGTSYDQVAMSPMNPRHTSRTTPKGFAAKFRMLAG